MTVPTPAPPTAAQALMGHTKAPAPTSLPKGKLHQPANTETGGRIVGGPESYHASKQDGRDAQGNVVYKKLYFPSGDPIWGVHVDLQTALRETRTDGQPDTGVRRLYIEGSDKDGLAYWSLRKAVQEACKAVGAPGLELGGELYVMWVGEVNTGAPSPAVDWRARYVRPGNVALGVVPQAAQQAYSAPVAHIPQQAAAPAAAPQMTPEQVAAYNAWQASQQAAPVPAPPF